MPNQIKGPKFGDTLAPNVCDSHLFNPFLLFLSLFLFFSFVLLFVVVLFLFLLWRVFQFLKWYGKEFRCFFHSSTTMD